MNTHANPYSPPQIEDAEQRVAVASIVEDETTTGYYFAWLFVFTLNLILPLAFGMTVARGSARYGVAIAALVLLVVGLLFCSVRRKFARIAVVGGALIALTQFFPLLQVVAGLISVGIASNLEQGLGLVPANVAENPADFAGTCVWSGVGGFAATLTTGGLLMGAAMFPGWLFELLSWQTARRNQRPTEANVPSRLDG